MIFFPQEAILTTMDIVHDGFGLMLVLGDLAWVPFLYCLQARFILEHPQHWSMWALGAILVLNSKCANKSSAVTIVSCQCTYCLLPDTNIWENNQTFSLYFALACCCMQNCALSYRLLGVWDLALYGKSSTVNIGRVSHIDWIVGCCNGITTMFYIVKSNLAKFGLQ